MSHTVKITTTTTTNSNALILNTGYLKSISGLLKLSELILGVVTVGIVAYYYDNFRDSHYSAGNSVLFFLLMAVTFLICTTCLLLACVVSWSTGGLISKTMFELIYHAVATILLLAASITLIVYVDRYRNFDNKLYKAYMAAGVLGLINACLYLASTVYAQRSYRGI